MECADKSAPGFDMACRVGGKLRQAAALQVDNFAANVVCGEDIAGQGAAAAGTGMPCPHKNAAGDGGNALIAQKRIGRDDLLVVRGRAVARPHRRNKIMKTNRTIAGWLALVGLAIFNSQPPSPKARRPLPAKASSTKTTPMPTGLIR